MNAAWESGWSSCSSAPSRSSSHTASPGQFWSSRSPGNPSRAPSLTENSYSGANTASEGTATTGGAPRSRRRIAAGPVQTAVPARTETRRKNTPMPGVTVPGTGAATAERSLQEDDLSQKPYGQYPVPA